MVSLKGKLLSPINIVLGRPVAMAGSRLYVEISEPDAMEQIIEVREHILEGTPLIKGTRIPVYFIFEYLKNGYNTAEIASMFPAIGEERIRKLIGHVTKFFEVNIETISG